MKHFKLFFALFAMLALGVGNAWGAEATVYTSNVELSTTDGTKAYASKAKISDVEYSAMKLGASGTAGNFYVNLPANTTSLTLHAAAWNNKTSNKLTLSSETAGVTISPSTAQTLTANSGVSGSSKTYTITPNNTNEFFTFTLTGATSGAKIKLACNERCLIWGVNAETTGDSENPGEGGGEDPNPDPEEPGTGGEALSYTWDLSINSYSAASNTQVTWSATDVNMVADKGTAGTAPNNYLGGDANNRKSSRFYKNSILTITPETNVTITSVVFTATSTSYATVLQESAWTNATASADNTTVTVTPTDGTTAISAKIDDTCGFTGVTVNYTKTGSGSTEPAASLTAAPTSLDFGNVTQNTEVEAKTFTISGSDFTTGELTITAPSGYTVNPTTVPVDGTLEEQTITVTPNTSNVGPFNGNVTISGANLKSSVTVALTMTVEKAPATPTENVYVKVTSTEGITDGEYLIVYETGNVAFNGALETLDVASNTVEVTISDNVITGNTDIDEALFTIDATNGTVLSASDKYIGGKSSNDNGINISETALENDLSIDQDDNAVIASNGKAIRYNKTAGQTRFRYFKDNGGTQEKIQLYKKASSHTVTIASCINGSVSADVASGATVLSGTTITLNNTPATGYKLAAYDVYKTGEESTKVTVTDGKFIMPEFDVTISATFELAKTLTSIDITTPATQTTFWQGETFNYEGLKVTAHFDGAADEDVTDKVTVTGSTATAGAAVEVTVSYNEGTTTETATYSITVKDIPNTKETAYTVADAFDIIDKLTTAEGVFITGIVSEIVTAYNEQYGNISYNISADGLTTSDQLQAYRGKSYDGANFTSPDDVKVGDEVVIKGTLKKFSTTYEFDENNQLVSLNRTKEQAGLAYAETEHNANVGEDFAEPTLTNPYSLSITYSSSNTTLATVNATTGEVTILAAGKVTITASTTGNASYSAGSASYNITITDPSLAVATLPFTFNSGKADIENTAGMTQEGLGSDYDNAPKLKFNTANDNVIVHFDSEPGEFSFLLKQNGTNAGTFTVYESANGEDYTPVWSGGDLGGTGKSTTIKPTLSATARYVKFEYTTKADGTNYALGSISIAKPDNRQEAGLAWDPETVTLTVGDAFTAPTLQNPKSVSGITYESSNEDVATVSAEGVIALVDDAVGTATITATFEGDLTYKPATATCTITVNEYIETIDGEWQLVTDASKLQIGMEIIIASVADADGTIKTMGVQNNNNRGEVSSTVSGDMLNPAVGTTVITLEDCQLYEGLFALKTKDGYLYAASSSKNQLKSQEGINDNACWMITITDGVASVQATKSSNRNIIRYNSNDKLFSCYDAENNQKDIAIYAKVPDCTREIPVGYYGTVCLPSNIIKVLGATLYEVAGKEDNGRVVFDEVLAPEAGMPYIFLSHNAEVLFYCGTETATAGKHNSLQGTFDEIAKAETNELTGNYMVVNNIIKKCGARCGLGANRAYFIATELESIGTAPAQMPGRRRVTMGVTGENGTTDLDNITTTDTPVKVIENGKLIIIRDGVKYNVQGQKL